VPRRLRLPQLQPTLTSILLPLLKRRRTNPQKQNLKRSLLVTQVLLPQVKTPLKMAETAVVAGAAMERKSEKKVVQVDLESKRGFVNKYEGY